MSNIKTWEELKRELISDHGLADHGDDYFMEEEIAQLRAALAKAEQERDALKAKLTALEGQETALWGNEGWMSSFGVCVGRDTSDCIDLIFTKVVGSEYQLYANEAAYLRYLLNKADIPGYAAAPVPEGWQLVPVEPTDSMFFDPDSVCVNSGESPWSAFRRIYRVLLAAAPRSAS